MTREKKEKEIKRYLDLLYLDLRFNLREFEEKEMPEMRAVLPLVRGLFGGVFAGVCDNLFPPAPERSKKEVKFRNDCYDMWNEMDKTTIWVS